MQWLSFSWPVSQKVHVSARQERVETEAHHEFPKLRPQNCGYTFADSHHCLHWRWLVRGALGVQGRARPAGLFGPDHNLVENRPGNEIKLKVAVSFRYDDKAAQQEMLPMVPDVENLQDNLAEEPVSGPWQPPVLHINQLVQEWHWRVQAYVTASGWAVRVCIPKDHNLFLKLQILSGRGREQIIGHDLHGKNRIVCVQGPAHQRYGFGPVVEKRQVFFVHGSGGERPDCFEE